VTEDAQEQVGDEERGSADDTLRPYLRRFEARIHGAELRAALQAVRDAGSDDAARARATEQARGQMDASLAALERLTREDPSDVALWQALADAYLQTARADEAVERLEAAMKDDPTLFGLLPTVAQLQVARNDLPAAEAALTAFGLDAASALQRGPTSGPPQARRAHAEDEDLEAIERWIGEPPDVASRRALGSGAKAEKRSDVTAFAHLALALLGPSDGFVTLAKDLSPEVSRKLEEARIRVTRRGYALQLYYVTSGRCSPSLREEADRIVRGADGNAAFQLFDGAGAMLLLADYLDGVAPPVPSLDLEIESGGENGTALRN